MLKKLLKHELKSSWMEMVIVNGAVLVISLLFALMVNVVSSSMTFLAMGLGSIFILYFVQVVLLVSNIIRSLNKKMFTNEGYLTFTLPVTIRELLVSKILINIFWTFVTSFMILLSMFIMGVLMTQTFNLTFIYFDAIEFVYKNFLPVLLMMVSFLIGAAFFIVVVIGVLTILNTGKMKKHKLLLGILIFYAFSTIHSWVEQFLVIIPYSLYINPVDGGWFIGPSYTIYSMIFNPDMLINGTPILSFNSILIQLVLIVGIFVFSEKMIKNHLELE